MKKIILFASIAMFLFSCSSSGPENAVKNFTENVAKGKIEEAKKYATESTGKMLDLASGFGTLDLKPNFKFKMLKDSIVENKAWVTFRDQNDRLKTMEVVKIDGKWLVHTGSKK